MDYTSCQVPLSVGFSRQEYWSGLPCPSPDHLPNPGIEPLRHLLRWQADSLPLSHLGSLLIPTGPVNGDSWVVYHFILLSWIYYLFSYNLTHKLCWHSFCFVLFCFLLVMSKRCLTLLFFHHEGGWSPFHEAIKGHFIFSTKCLLNSLAHSAFRLFIFFISEFRSTLLLMVSAA